MKNVHRFLLAMVLGAFSIVLLAGEATDLDVPEIPQADEPETPLEEFSQTMVLVDGLRVYNTQLDRLLADQERDIATLEESIDAVEYTKRQIGPLTERMIESLEAFIELDLPFRLEERRARVERLRNLISRPDIHTAEKFREVVEAYQKEIDYGNSRGAYLDFIEVEGSLRQVDILRWGRTVLAFQTSDGEITGVWDNEARHWKVLDDSYSDGVRDALRMTRDTITNDLVILPVKAPK